MKLSDRLIGAVAKNHARLQRGNTAVSWDKIIRSHANETKIVDAKVEYNLLPVGDIGDFSPSFNYGQYEMAYHSEFKQVFKDKLFRRINADRDIQPEGFDLDEKLANNGKGATNIVWKYLSMKAYNQNVIKKDFFQALNDIIRPDIEFRDLCIKEEGASGVDRKHFTGEIQFEDRSGNWVDLSKMGSGVKTIILVLLNLIVIPQMARLTAGDFVFGFEELENNLHPSLQRRLFDYIANYAKKYKAVFFITSHSSIVIDLFSSKGDIAQILHVENIEGTVRVSAINDNIGGQKILRDLDYKPSDLLLSNGVIWVEGPSDILYLRLFMELYLIEHNNLESLNFSIQSLSPAVWKYAGFSEFDFSFFRSRIFITRRIL